MPGWGSWGGAGVVVSARAKAHKERREKQILEKHTQKVSQIMSSRSDAKLDGVIITQKKDKKAVKFGVPALPHMYIHQIISIKTRTHQMHQLSPRLEFIVDYIILLLLFVHGVVYLQSRFTSPAQFNAALATPLGIC